MLPTFGVSVEQYMMDDVEQTYANLRSFNRWMEEEWGFGADGRIVAPPLLSLLDRDLAVAELDRVLAGAPAWCTSGPARPAGGGRWPTRGTTRSGPASTRPACRWHSTSPTTATPRCRWRGARTPTRRCGRCRRSSGPSCTATGPIMETLGALIYGNMFARFPNLDVLSIENGSDWVHYLLTLLDKKKGMGRYGRGRAGARRAAERHLPGALLRLPVPGGRRRPSSSASAPARSCSGPTSPIPRAWPTRCASSTCSRPGRMRRSGW